MRYAVGGSQGVNAYVDPLVSLDIALVVAADDRDRAVSALERVFRVERFPHSVNVSQGGSQLRVRIHTDPRYDEFVAGSTERDVLGWSLHVADLKDILQGTIWAAEDPARRPGKRLKDLTDIARIVEKFPDLRAQVPASLLGRID